jgi:hypothetical protein
VLAYLAQSRGLRVQDGTAAEVAAELLRRLQKEFSALGFSVADGDRDSLLALMRRDLSSRRMTEATLDVLTVRALVDFICVKLGPRLQG